MEVNNNPGERSSKVTVSLQLLSSVGGDIVIPEPPNATLQNVFVGGQAATVEEENAQITLPLHPGLQSAQRE